MADVTRIVQILGRCPLCLAGGVPAGGCLAVTGPDRQCFAADSNADGCITAADFSRVLGGIRH